MERYDGLKVGTEKGYPKSHRGGEEQALERGNTAPAQYKSECNSQDKDGQEKTSQSQETINEPIGNTCTQKPCTIPYTLCGISSHNKLGSILRTMQNTLVLLYRKEVMHHSDRDI